MSKVPRRNTNHVKIMMEQNAEKRSEEQQNKPTNPLFSSGDK